MLDLDQVRRSSRDRAGDDGPIVAQGRYVMGLDLDVVGRPRSPFGQRAVLERDRPIDQRKPIDGDVESLLGRLRAFEEVGEVEAPLESYDAKGWLAQDQLSDPDVAPRERKQVQPSVEQLAVRERRAPVRLRDAQSVDRDPPAQQLDVDSIDGHRPLRDRVESSDRDAPRERREGIECRGDPDQQ